MNNLIWIIGYLILTLLVTAEMVFIINLFSTIKELKLKIKSGLALNAAESRKPPDMGGPELGSNVPQLKAETPSGQLISIGGRSSMKTILLFISPNCAPCKSMIPQFKNYVKSSSVEIIAICRSEYDLEHSTVQMYEQLFGESNIPFIVSKNILQELKIRGFPSYLIIDETDKIIEKNYLFNLNVLEKYGLSAMQKVV